MAAMKPKPIVAFPKRRFYGSGNTVVTERDLELRKCPACKGTGKKTLSTLVDVTGLSAFAKKSETAWWCDLCGGVGQIRCTERTYRDLQEHYS